MARDYKHPFRCGPGPCTWYCEPTEEPPPIEVCAPVVTFDCPENDRDATIYHLSVAGFANGDCQDCDAYNGQHDLTYALSDPAGLVVFHSPAYPAAICGKPANDPLWTMHRAGDGTYMLTANGTGNVWSLAAGSWSCAAPKTFTRFGEGTECIGSPEELTLIPCLTGCLNCVGGEAPGQLLLEIPAMGNGRCNDCDSISGEYILPTQGACSYRGTFPNPSTCTNDIGQPAHSIEITAVIGPTTVEVYIYLISAINYERMCNWVVDGADFDCMNWDRFEVPLLVGSGVICNNPIYGPVGGPVYVTTL